MVAHPVVVLGTQPQGGLSLIAARTYVAECRSSKKHQIICCECPVATAEHADVTQVAYARAKAVLEHYPEAVVGVGLHTGIRRLVNKQAIVPVSMTAAALVMRNDHTPVVLATTDISNDAVARMVKQALSQWKKRSESGSGYGPLITRFVRKAVGLGR